MSTDGRGEAVRLINAARRRGRQALAEHEAKQLLAAYGLPVTRETLATSPGEAAAAAAALGYPVALKASSAEIPHKSEAGLVRLGLADEAAVLAAYGALAAALAGRPGGVLVQEMLAPGRELNLGLVRDPTFGPCVMFGLGGIFTEALGDAVFRRAPLEQAEALGMMEEIRGRRLLDAGRGQPSADRRALAAMLVGLGRIGLVHDAIAAVDVNPVILVGARPVVADAFIALT